MAFDARSLLRRAQHPANDPARPAAISMRDAILDHLRLMCHTRRGTMRTRPDFGLPDIGQVMNSCPDSIAELSSAILHTIATYEPRLADVRIRFVAEERQTRVLRFEITATLTAVADGTTLTFETSVDAGRRFVVD